MIPTLTFAGLISAIFSVFVWWPAIASVRNGSLFVVLASVSFSLALGAVLWFYGLIESWRTLAAVLGVTVAAHLLELYGELHLPIRLREYVDIPAVGSVEPRVAVMSFAVSLILYVALLMLTTPRGRIGSALLVAVVCASLTGVTIAAIDATQRGAWFSLWKGDALEPLWQVALAFFLAIALALKGVISPLHVSVSQEKPHASFRTRFAAFGVLLVFWAATATWSYSTQVLYRKRNVELQARQKAEVAKSLADVPTFENLSMPAPKPLDQVLLLQEINGWKPYFSGAQDYPAQKNGGDMVAPVPERRTYYARYATPGNSSPVAANVTEYPNAEWAMYAVRDTPMPQEFINHPDWIKHLFRFGNNLFQEGPYFFWSSGDRLIMLDCQGVQPDVIDGFLQAYLEKYPSSVHVQE